MPDVKAVFWDFGGVVSSSPFDAFAEMEQAKGIEPGAVRRINSINPDANAWAKFERNEIDRNEFGAAFAAEAAALGYEITGEDVLGCLAGTPRPVMVRALERLRSHYRLACLTNNVARLPRPPEVEAELARIMGLFHHVVESSKAGCRKPEEKFYWIALDLAGVDASEVVFLDDLGINLKPARAMGMRTIKVTAPEPALAELGEILGVDLLVSG